MGTLKIIHACYFEHNVDMYMYRSQSYDCELQSQLCKNVQRQECILETKISSFTMKNGVGSLLQHWCCSSCKFKSHRIGIIAWKVNRCRFNESVLTEKFLEFFYYGMLDNIEDKNRSKKLSGKFYINQLLDLIAQKP
jgi:hypothetical protein